MAIYFRLCSKLSPQIHRRYTALWNTVIFRMSELQGNLQYSIAYCIPRGTYTASGKKWTP